MDRKATLVTFLALSTLFVPVSFIWPALSAQAPRITKIRCVTCGSSSSADYDFSPVNTEQQAGAEANETGLQAYTKGDWQKAIENFRRALEHLAHDPYILKNLRAAEYQLHLAQQQAAIEKQLEEERRRRQLEQQQRTEAAATLGDALDRLADALRTNPQGAFDGSASPARRLGFVGTERSSPPSIGFADPGRSTTPQLGFVSNVPAPILSEIGQIRRGLRTIQVPPPIPPRSLLIGFGDVVPKDVTSARVLLGLDVGIGVADVVLELGSIALPAVKLIVATGKTIIAAEDAADVYLVRQHETYENALRWLKSDRSRLEFAKTVQAVREGGAIPENASVEMVRTARAILDPKLGNTGRRIAFDALLSPEARRAAFTQVAIEFAGEVLGQGANRAVRDIVAARNPAFQEATDFLSKAHAALERTSNPAARTVLGDAIEQANQMIAAAYRAARPASHAAEHIEALFIRHTLEAGLEKKVPRD